MRILFICLFVSVSVAINVRSHINIAVNFTLRVRVIFLSLFLFFSYSINNIYTKWIDRNWYLLLLPLPLLSRTCKLYCVKSHINRVFFPFSPFCCCWLKSIHLKSKNDEQSMFSSTAPYELLPLLVAIYTYNKDLLACLLLFIVISLLDFFRYSSVCYSICLMFFFFSFFKLKYIYRSKYYYTWKFKANTDAHINNNMLQMEHRLNLIYILKKCYSSRYTLT